MSSFCNQTKRVVSIILSSYGLILYNSDNIFIYYNNPFLMMYFRAKIQESYSTLFWWIGQNIKVEHIKREQGFGLGNCVAVIKYFSLYLIVDIHWILLVDSSLSYTFQTIKYFLYLISNSFNRLCMTLMIDCCH